MAELSEDGIIKLIDRYKETYIGNPSILLSGYSQENQTVADYEGRQLLELMQNADDAKSGAGTGMAALIAMTIALLEKNTKGGLVVVGQLNLGGSLDLIYDAINIAETAIEKGATTLLIPLNARKQLNELSDDMITKINIQYYTDLKDCLLKSLVE